MSKAVRHASIHFHLPHTDLKVQHWLDDDDDTLDGESSAA